MDETGSNLAANARRLREARGLSQQQMAQLSGIPRPTWASLEAGDANPNAVHDMKLPLKLIVGVRSARAARTGKTADNCPHFAEKVIAAWELPHTRFDPAEADTAALAGALKALVDQPTAAALLWAE